MKKKFRIGPFKFKLSYKNSRWLNLFMDKNYNKQLVNNNVIQHDANYLLEYKLYRIFKEQYCEFFHGNNYGLHGTEPSSLVYYVNINKDIKELIGSVKFNEDVIEFYKCRIDPFKKDKYLIGEFMFGEDKIAFFKRKNILIKETIENYSIVQDEFILAVYDKEWIAKQGIYQ